MGNGIISAISNYKGGVGKTVTSVNLSAALAIKKKKVLLIDIDPQSDSTRALIQSSASIEDTMYQILDPEGEEITSVENFIYPTIHENLFILPNITETSGLEIPLAQDFPESNMFLRNNLKDYVKNNFDYIFIDCPPTLSIFVSNALHCADCVIIPTDAGSGNSIEGVRGVLEMMESIKYRGNPELKFLKILVTRIDKRKTAHRANINNIRTRFGADNTFKTTIPTSGLFEATETTTKSTIFTYYANSKGATAYRNLSKEFLNFFE